MAFEQDAAAHDEAMKEWFRHSIMGSSDSDHSDEDYYGTELGGEWDHIGFTIRSGIVLTLGALEEFERGVLRILCAYEDGKPDAGSATLPFLPRLVDYQMRSPRWDAVERKRKTHTVTGRHKLLKSFGINMDIDAKWNERLSQMRN